MADLSRLLTKGAALLAVTALAAGSALAVKPEITKADRHDVSKPLRDIAPIAPVFHPHEKPIRIVRRDVTERPDGALQTEAGPLVAATAGTGFAGLGLG